MFILDILHIVAACIIVISLMYSGATKAAGQNIRSVAAFIIGCLAVVGMGVLGFVQGNESCTASTVSTPPRCQPLSAHEGSEAGFDDTAWDTVASSEDPDEVCDVMDNDCGDIPISYSDDGCEVTFHYPDRDVRMTDFSGCGAWWDDALTP